VFDRRDEHDLRDPLEALLARELRKPVPTSPARKARIMDLVRATAARGRRPGVRGLGRGTRAGWASPAVGVALAAGFAGVVTLGALRSPAPFDGGTGDAAHTLTDTVDTVAAALRDTARLVRFMLVAPRASRVTLAGDFNRWDTAATPLVAAESGGVWSVAVALAPGRHRYAFVVDDTQWIADPAAGGAVGAGGRPHSVTTVVRPSN